MYTLAPGGIVANELSSFLKPNDPYANRASALTKAFSPTCIKGMAISNP